MDIRRLKKINKKDIYPFILTAVLLIILVNSIKSISNMKAGINRLENAQSNLERLKQENTNLKEKIEYANSEGFIEKEALEKLNMTKSGYNIVIVDGVKPEDQNQDTGGSSGSTNFPNYRLWLFEFNL